MRLIIPTVALLVALQGTAFSQRLPTAGSCEPQGDALINLGIPSVTWIGSEVVVQDAGQKKYKGKMVGMREHDTTFKFSVRYRDDLMGLSEISIFRIPQNKLLIDRMGVIHFTELADGDRVINAILGYANAKCSFQF